MWQEYGGIIKVLYGHFKSGSFQTCMMMYIRQDLYATHEVLFYALPQSLAELHIPCPSLISRDASEEKDVSWTVFEGGLVGLS